MGQGSRSIRLIALAASLAACTADSSTPEMKDPEAGRVLIAESEVVQVRRGADGRLTGWRLAPELDPDVLGIQVPPGEKRRACFFSGADSLCHSVGLDEAYDFVIRFDGQDYPTRILGEPPAAVFNEAYREAHRGRITATVPEVYEMVNVAIALTPFTRQEDNYLVAKRGPYYEEVMGHFSAVEQHPFVRWLDAELERGNYSSTKMSGYAFVFDSSGIIRRSPVYNSTNFVGQGNVLLPELEQMQSFADASDFQEFYRTNRELYAEQESFMRDSLGVEQMLDWLRRNFPDVEFYDYVNIIFSPLVRGNQSVTWFRYTGFSEIQPHVNFPYERRLSGDDQLTPSSIRLRRGALLFTELNHGFINPTASLYSDRIAAAMQNRASWVDPEKSAASYGWPESVFNEMMNWALVSLYYVDYAPESDLDLLVSRNARWQSEGRGFLQAPEFHEFLIDLYRDRPEGATAADLYPEIVDWFAAQSEQAGPGEDGSGGP
jgi:hypothetical protein